MNMDLRAPKSGADLEMWFSSVVWDAVKYVTERGLPASMVALLLASILRSVGAQADVGLRSKWRDERDALAAVLTRFCDAADIGHMDEGSLAAVVTPAEVEAARRLIREVRDGV